MTASRTKQHPQEPDGPGGGGRRKTGPTAERQTEDGGMSGTFDAHLADARRRFGAFLDALPASARLVVFCHNDGDGLGAGALFGRALPRLGFDQTAVIPSLRGESAFSDDARERLRARRLDALIVTDLGVRADGVLAGVPTLYVDHHRPSGTPPDAVVISGYDWDPIPTSAWLAFELLRSRAEVEDLAWLAALGTISDLGDRAPWPELPRLRKRYGATWLKEAVVLVNAARRASACDVETPLRILLEADHPRALSEDSGAERLHAYRREVNEELARARRQPPTFSATGPFALIRLNSACQIHPLIAQQWRGRLREYAVIAANTGYLPERVAFSMRTARRDLNLPELLQATGIRASDAHFGQGHDQASGGHLPPTDFLELLSELGFTEPDAS